MNEIGEVRKLAAIVMMDVVGYSRLVEHDVTATLAALTDQRQTLIGPTVAAHQGRLVNAPGDSTLLEFSSVTNAVRCAIAIQQGMLTRNSTIDPEQRIALRIGVNIGDVIVQRGEIFGDGVNVAARLETLAEPGGICLSRGVYEQIRGAIDVGFIDGGPRSVKNIRHPIEIYSLPAHVIAALPPILALPVGRRRRWRRLAMAIGAILVVGGTIGTVTFGHRGTPEQRRQRDLTAALASVLPASTEATRAKSIASYLATPGHRAFVIAPRAHSPWWSGEWSTPAEAEDKSLERCQAALSEPCGSLAIDDDVKGTSLVLRDMPRVHYAGPFNPFWIPGVRASANKRSAIATYSSAPEPKAIAYNVRGLVFVVTGATTQHEAEEKALTTCNTEAARKDVEASCFLYASANQVVFPERRTSPRASP